MELIRVRLAYESKMGLSKIYKQMTSGGVITGLYRGLGPTLIGMVPYAGVSFAAHDMLQKALKEHVPAAGNAGNSRKPLKVWAELTAGGLAGAVAQTVSYPLEITRRRMQVADIAGYSKGFLPTVRFIWSSQGWRGFFVGLSIGYIKVIPMVGISFTVYERAKSILNA